MSYFPSLPGFNQPAFETVADESETQLNGLKNQIEHYTDTISACNSVGELIEISDDLSALYQQCVPDEPQTALQKKVAEKFEVFKSVYKPLYDNLCRKERENFQQQDTVDTTNQRQQTFPTYQAQQTLPTKANENDFCSLGGELYQYQSKPEEYRWIHVVPNALTPMPSPQQTFPTNANKNELCSVDGKLYQCQLNPKEYQWVLVDRNALAATPSRQPMPVSQQTFPKNAVKGEFCRVNGERYQCQLVPGGQFGWVRVNDKPQTATSSPQQLYSTSTQSRTFGPQQKGLPDKTQTPQPMPVSQQMFPIGAVKGEFCRVNGERYQCQLVPGGQFGWVRVNDKPQAATSSPQQPYSVSTQSMTSGMQQTQQPKTALTATSKLQQTSQQGRPSFITSDAFIFGEEEEEEIRPPIPAIFDQLLDPDDPVNAAYIQEVDSFLSLSSNTENHNLGANGLPTILNKTDEEEFLVKKAIQLSLQEKKPELNTTVNPLVPSNSELAIDPTSQRLSPSNTKSSLSSPSQQKEEGKEDFSMSANPVLPQPSLKRKVPTEDVTGEKLKQLPNTEELRKARLARFTVTKEKEEEVSET